MPNNPYLEFYLGKSSQSGAGDIYRGHFHHPHKGYGIGTILSGLFKASMPILKRGAKSVGKHLLRAAPQVLGDVLQGRKIGQSLKNRGMQAVHNIVESEIGRMPTNRKRKAPPRTVTSYKRRAPSKKRKKKLDFNF